MTDLPDMRRLELEDPGNGVLLKICDRPQVLNALDTVTSEDLRDLFRALACAPGPWRCIVLTGTRSTQTLPRAVGERPARDFNMTGTPFAAIEAAEWGLVNRLLPLADLLPETPKTAETIARNAPVLVRQIKRAIRYGWSADIVQGREIEVMAFAAIITAGDRTQGVSAFNEIYAPVFRNRRRCPRAALLTRRSRSAPPRTFSVGPAAPQRSPTARALPPSDRRFQ